MAISASRYTVVTGFKDVLLVHVEGCLLYVCWIVAEKYCTKHLSKKSFLELEKKKAFVYIYILIRNALPWLWRYGLVSLHPIHHREQKMALTWLHIQWRDSVLWNSSWTHSESISCLKGVHLEGDSFEDNVAPSSRGKVFYFIGCSRWWLMNQ